MEDLSQENDKSALNIITIWCSILACTTTFWIASLILKLGEEASDCCAYATIGISLLFATYYQTKTSNNPKKPDRASLTNNQISATLLYCIIITTIGALVFIPNQNSIFWGFYVCLIFSLFSVISQKQPSDSIRNISCLLFFFLFFLLAYRLCWWGDLPLNLELGLLLLAVFSCFIYNDISLSSLSLRPKLKILICTILSLFFIWISLRKDAITTATGYHHLGVYTGAIQGVRDGGHILWDVPSQYGFLSILLPASLGFLAAEDAFYLVNSILVTIVSLGLFWGLTYIFEKGNNSSIFSSICSFLLVLCSFFLFSRFADPGFAPAMYPSTGPMRFIWCYLLIFLIYKTKNCKPESEALLSKLGAITWLIASLWSCESFLYTTFIWIPFYYRNIFLRLSGVKINNQEVKLTSLIATLILPVLQLGILVTIITTAYFIYYGHFPDPVSFSDYCISFGGGFGGFPINFHGAIWIWITAFSFLVLAIPKTIKNNLNSNQFGLILSLMGLLYGTLTYFIARSHENNLVNLLPLLLLTLVILKEIYAKSQSDISFQLFQLFFYAVCIISISVPVFHERTFNRAIYPASLLTKKIRTIYPVLEDEPLELIKKSSVTDLTQVYYLSRERTIMPLVPGYPNQTIARSWLPMPSNALIPLPDYRLKIYLDRFLSRVSPPAVVWILVENNLPYTDLRILDYADKHFRRKTVYENNNWKMISYDTTS